ncbi:MAG: TonB-dependent receptor [Rhodospirillaceae bacterium]
MRRSYKLLSTALLTTTAMTGVTMVPSTAVQAQQSAMALEEIVVTATRRAESVQDIPINITAVAAGDIEKLRLNNVAELARWVPGLNLTDQGPRGGNQLSVRGLNTDSLNASEFLDNGNGDTVATYIGEIPLYLDLKLYDMERVEVLIGPQGTLYGAGTLGGAVRYIPNKADPSEFSGSVHVSSYDLGESGSLGFEGDIVLNVPLIEDKVAARLVVGYLDDPGFIDYDFLVQNPGVSLPQPDFTDPAAVAANLTSVEDANDEQTLSARLNLLFNVTENFEASFSYYYQDQKAGGRQITHRRALGTDEYVSAHRYLEPSDRKNQLISAELNWDLGWATLTSATGYSEYDELGQRDQSDLLIAFEYGYESFPAFAAFTREQSDEKRFNQELRLVSSNDGPFSWIVGAFYNDFEGDATSEEFTPGIPEFFGIDRPDNLEYIQRTLQNLEEKAVFGEVGYEITDAFQVTVGGRYYDYSVDDSVGFDLPLLSGDPTAININLAQNVVSDDGFLYKVNASYQINDDVLVYGTVSEGYRIGGVNAVPACPTPIPPGQNVCALPDEELIKPDQTLNKEIGIKSAFDDGRIVLNASLYHIDWDDIQVQSITQNGGVPITVNGGKAVSKGFEVSGRAVLNDNFAVTGTWAYVDAKLTEDAPGLVDSNDAFDGDRLAGTPKHSASASLDYYRTLGNDYELNFNYGMTYISNVYTKTGLRNNGQVLAGFAVHNSSLTLSKDQWELSLFADNLFDEFAVTSVRQDLSLVRDVNGVALRRYFENVIRPRVVGIEARYRF